MPLFRPSVLKRLSTLCPALTFPKTVWPPFCVSNSAALLLKLKYQTELAESGKPGTFAIASVPSTLLRGVLKSNSLVMSPKVGTRVAKENGDDENGFAMVYSPPCSTKLGMQRLRMVLS